MSSFLNPDLSQSLTHGHVPFDKSAMQTQSVRSRVLLQLTDVSHAELAFAGTGKVVSWLSSVLARESNLKNTKNA